MMVYLKDFYPLDIDDPDTEYVITEMKYNTDILMLDPDFIANEDDPLSP